MCYHPSVARQAERHRQGLSSNGNGASSEQQSRRKPPQHNTRHYNHYTFNREDTQIPSDHYPATTASIVLLSLPYPL